MTSPARKSSLVDQVYGHLTSQLANRSIQLGDRINARKIADNLGVSRTTVNKAVEKLAAAGWVKSDGGRHLVVVSLPPRLTVHSDTPFEFANQTDACYEQLLERILRGDFEPGAIIKERPLALEMGVNPATLRRAAEWLRNDGLVERLPRRGWRIITLTAHDIRDLFKIRTELEAMAMDEAVRRLTDTSVDELENETRQLMARGENSTPYERRAADMKFHQTIAAASGSRILPETLDPLIRKVLLYTTVAFRFTRATQSFEEHLDILKAVRERNAKKAVRLIRAHLRTSMKFNLGVWDR